MTMQAQDIRDRALRVIAYGSQQNMKEFLAEVDPEGYYPEAEKRNGLWVHIAQVMCAREQGTDTGSLVEELMRACEAADTWFRKRHDIGTPLPNHHDVWLQLARALRCYREAMK